jgi:uncharacterized membrane protein
MSDVGENKPSDPPVVQETGGSSVEVLREVRVRSTSWSGPLPAPADLQLFEEIVPGAADRILTLTEKQSEHRMSLERSVVSENLKQSKLGLIAGFVLSAMVIFGGIFLIYLGHDWAGGILISINLVGLAGVFVYGSRSHRAQRRERHESLAEKADMDTNDPRLQDPD